MPIKPDMVDHPRIRAWLEIRAPLERQLEPLGRLAMEALALSAGERVLDVGCGIGGTPIALSAAVGPHGRVVGLELLQAAVDVTRRDQDERDTVTILCGDAQTYAFEPGSFDVVFSRFGLMFFDDPIAAFRNLLNALRPGGRLGFVCWRDISENELDYLPLQAASTHLPPDLLSLAASSASFSFSDPGHVRAILGEAGFLDIDIATRDEAVCCGSLQETVDVCSRVGALGAILHAPTPQARSYPGIATRLVRARQPHRPGSPRGNLGDHRPISVLFGL